MDILGGLSAVNLAIGIARDLRSIDRSLDEATFKLKLADLTTALADTQLALAEAKLKVSELEQSISLLSEGPRCPICLEGRLKVISVQDRSFSGQFEFHQCGCSSSGCRYTSLRRYDVNLCRYE